MCLAIWHKNPKNLLSLRHVMQTVGQHVFFMYNGQICPGKTTAFSDQHVSVNAMQKSTKLWKWLEKKHKVNYSWEDLLGTINLPIQVSWSRFYSILALEGNVVGGKVKYCTVQLYSKMLTCIYIPVSTILYLRELHNEVFWSNAEKQSKHNVNFFCSSVYDLVQ